MLTREILPTLLRRLNNYTVTLLMTTTAEKIEAAKQVLGATRFNLESAEKATEEAQTYLNAFVEAATRVETLTLRPSDPSVVKFMLESKATLQLLANELAICKYITDKGNNRKRNPITES